MAARFIAGATWDNLPAAVQKKARMCLMDNLGATISGAQTRISRTAARFASTCMPGAEATILLHGRKAATAGAAFANGCAAVAAHLMKLDIERVRQALGIAEYHAPNLPMMRDIAHPAMVKHGIGWAPLTGIIAAQLASFGFTGIPTLFSFDKYREWVADIGSNYIMVDGVAWKAKGYACCGWAHAAVEGSRKLMVEHNVDPRQIDRIVVETFRESAALGTRLPQTTKQAQFNLAWPVAAMLVDGQVGPEQTLEERLQDETIRTLAGKVEVRESEELNELCRLFEKGDPRGRFASAGARPGSPCREDCDMKPDSTISLSAESIATARGDVKGCDSI